jgi:hypothetical protein
MAAREPDRSPLFTRRARQAIEPRHDQHIALAEPRDGLAQLGAIRLGAAGLLAENLGAAGGAERGVLGGERLSYLAQRCAGGYLAAGMPSPLFSEGKSVILPFSPFSTERTFLTLFF